MATARNQRIVDGGQLTLRHPFQLSEVTAFAFAIRADLAQLDRLCDATLNLGGKIEYHPVAPFVLATFLRAERVSSLHPQDAAKGFLRETELSFALPLLAVRRTFGFAVPQRLVWHFPALWVDSGPVLTAGREVYGYPKQLGRVTMPAGLNRPATFAAEAEVIGRYGQAEHASFRPIATVRRTDGDSVEATVASRLADAFLDFARRMFERDTAASQATRRIRKAVAKARRFWERELQLHEPLVLAFLKQFPSIENAEECCHQAVVEAPVRINGFRGAGVLAGDYEVEIPHYDSLDLASALGLEGVTDAGGTLRASAEFGFFGDVDFSLNAGRVIHSTS